MAMEEMKYTRWRENPADHCHHTREEAHGGCPVVCRWGLPRWPSGKESPANAGDIRDVGSIPGLGRSPGVGNGNHCVFLPGKRHGQRSLVGYRPWGRKESDITKETSQADTHSL